MSWTWSGRWQPVERQSWRWLAPPAAARPGPLKHASCCGTPLNWRRRSVVSARRIGLTTAWRQARQHQKKPPIDLESDTDLSVAELAHLLQVYTSTVYTHIRRGRIRADPDRRPLRISAHAVRDYLASTGRTSRCQQDMLTRGQAAKALRIPARQVTSLAHSGLLPYQRTPGGHARFPMPTSGY